MLDEYKRHNLYKEGLERFVREDPQLSALQGLAFIHPLDWWKAIDWSLPGIVILTGGRQIGKSTSVKLLIKHLLEQRQFPSTNIFYLPCDQIIDAAQLHQTIRIFLEELPSPPAPFILIIDEVTFVREWDRTIKALADEGWFRRGFCLLTGSDSIILQEAAVRFPGRRGNAPVVDFHLLPLSFREYVDLVQPDIIANPATHIEHLFLLFDQYLHCGGFLRAINEFHTHGAIGAATYATFEQWIRGDCLKRGKNESFLLAILQALLDVGVSQISYSALTERVGTISKETLLDYCRLLERMDVLFTLQAFDQNTQRGFPKKARKFHFCDPFIRATIARWLTREHLSIKAPEEAAVVEATVAAQYHRRMPTYYMKGTSGEIDLICSVGKQFVPIEVKWTRQLRPNDFNQLRKYRSAVLLGKQPERRIVDGVRSDPLPLFLIEHYEVETLRALMT